MKKVKKYYTDMHEEDFVNLPILAQRLRLLLERDGITLNQLGKRLGKSPSVMKNYLEKPVDIGISALTEIADVFKVPTDYLLGRTDCQTMDDNLRGICDYTGLSDSTVMGLHNSPDSITDLTRLFIDEFSTSIDRITLERLLVVISMAEKRQEEDFLTDTSTSATTDYVGDFLMASKCSLSAEDAAEFFYRKASDLFSQSINKILREMVRNIKHSITLETYEPE